MLWLTAAFAEPVPGPDDVAPAMLPAEGSFGTEHGEHQLFFDFSNGVQGWAGGTNGGIYDKAWWTSSAGNPPGALLLDGSNFGHRGSLPNSWFCRRIILPTNAVALRFDTSACDEGLLRVRLQHADSTFVTLLDWEALTNVGSFVTRTASLTNCAGQSVTIYFEQMDGGRGIGEYRYVDNVMVLRLGRAISSPGAPELLTAFPGADGSPLNPTNGLGSWIWDEKTYGRQTCRFWRSFEVPGSAQVVRGLLRITADNAYTLFLDGREVGKGSYWRVVTEYDLTWLLSSGTHVLGVDAFNDADSGGENVAGVVLGLRLVCADGHVFELGSDQSWRVVPETERGWNTRKHASAHWPAATVLGPWGEQPQWQTPWKLVQVPPERPLLTHFWQAGWFQVALLTLCGLAVVICLRLMAQVTLQAKAQQLVQLERARIARDIHDELGAGLTKLVLLGEVIRNELQLELTAREQIGQLCDKARNLSHIMDEIVWAINSRRDTLRDFATYVCKYAQEFLSATPIRCRLEVEPELPAAAFDLPVRRNLFLAVKEALNNAAKHSGASELFLHIHRQGDGLVVTVVDNGKGFDFAHAGPERNGLTNMAQRMNEVGGHCRVSGELGTGCRVEFNLPRLQAQRRPRWFGWRSGRLARQPFPSDGVLGACPPTAAGTNGSLKSRNI